MPIYFYDFLIIFGINYYLIHLFDYLSVYQSIYFLNFIHPQKLILMNIHLVNLNNPYFINNNFYLNYLIQNYYLHFLQKHFLIVLIHNFLIKITRSKFITYFGYFFLFNLSFSLHSANETFKFKLDFYLCKVYYFLLNFYLIICFYSYHSSPIFFYYF